MGAPWLVWCAAPGTHQSAVHRSRCLADYDALLANGNFDLHGEYFFVPVCRIFTAAEISALVAPRAHLSCFGRDDPLTLPTGKRA